jgi:serine/threonine protein kinase
MESFTQEVKFNLLKKIAEGGMGSVYKASQLGIEGFEKLVAIKTMHSTLSENDKCVEMFITEAKLVADLVHENIVQIYQFGKRDEEYYLVLEFVDGISLHEFINFHNVISSKIPVELSTFIASRIARGLAYAHSRLDKVGNPRNIVHRDICPRNVLITTEGLPKLTDFGIAKARHTSQEVTLSGKPLFMSPEQACKLPADFRSDIYSLGFLFFNMLTGEPTRKYDKGIPDILRQAKEGYVDWDILPSDLPKEVLNPLIRMLSLEPDDRYQNTTELAKDLEYAIYKDGYGPTIVTLAEYMQKQMPYIYSNKTKVGNPEMENTSLLKTQTLGDYADITELNETIIMDKNNSKVEMPTKTEKFINDDDLEDTKV